MTATLSTGDIVGLNLTGSTGPNGTWQSTWPVQPGTDGERIVDFRGEDEGGQVGHGETALVIDTLLPGPPWMSSPRGTTWVGRPQVTVVGQGAPLSRLQLELDGSPAKSTIIDANGEWVIEQPLSDKEHRLRTRLTDLAGNQSGFSNGATVKVDLEPPQVTLSAPPVSEGSFIVEWEGDDGDGSGVVAYQVEYQDNGGPWKTLVTETLELEAPFSGELYHEYTFRVRARDLVGHVSDWITYTVAIVNQTKYYFLEGRRVAMRKGDKVFYLYGDHLGSTSLTTDENGIKLSEDRYLPYGGGRLSNGISPTDFGFTDQRNEVGLGLIDYNARYYDPYLGRFISPDTIVPEPTSSGGLNRYRYARNNPLKYTDPSGHQECQEAWGDCRPQPKPSGAVPDNQVHFASKTFKDGTPGGRSYGVIVDSNAAISHHHHLDPGQTPSDLGQITLSDSNGNTIGTYEYRVDFLMADDEDLGGGLSLFVFKDDVFAGYTPARMAGVASVNEGDTLFQSASRGIVPGLYETKVYDKTTVNPSTRSAYEALQVSPDVTVQGDSGAGLYDATGQTVYGVNNSSTSATQANYGVIDVSGVQRMQNDLTTTLRQPWVIVK